MIICVVLNYRSYLVKTAFKKKRVGLQVVPRQALYKVQHEHRRYSVERKEEKTNLMPCARLYEGWSGMNESHAAFQANCTHFS